MCLCALTWSSSRPVARNASNCARISCASWRRISGSKKKRRPARARLRVELAVAPTSPETVAGAEHRAAFDQNEMQPDLQAAAGGAPAPPRRPPPARRPSGSRSVRMPSRCASSTASLTAASSPKSSAQTMSASQPRHLPVAQELEELDAFAQPPAHHLRALDHLADERGDLWPAEIEAFVEGLERCRRSRCATDADSAAVRSARRARRSARHGRCRASHSRPPGDSR